jgi:serine/threonine protein kinase
MAFRQADSYEAVERFKREARASAKIRSRHVVRVIDADVDAELGGTPYLVMDLLEGKDLENLAGTIPQPPTAVVQWLAQVACGLDKAHRIGVIHRDLKPENIFLCASEDGAPLIKIVDFGIAKLPAESAATTHSGQILGTPLYMAPEQARGDAAISPALDLYTLGLIAYRLLAGRTYWTAPTVVGIIDQLLNEPMVAPSARGCALGPAFDSWFLRACARDPSRRFASASDMIEQLAIALAVSLPSVGHASDDALALEQEPSTKPFEGPNPSSWLSARGSLLVLGATAAAMLLVGVMGTRWARRSEESAVVSNAVGAASATAVSSSPPAAPPAAQSVDEPSESVPVASPPVPDAGQSHKRPKKRTAAPVPGARRRDAFVYDPLADQK